MSDISTLNGGTIFYRLVTDNESLIKISKDLKVSASINDPYQSLPNWAFVITWYKVMPHGWNDMDITNTFQLVIVVDEAYSFFIFNYDSLKWPNKKIDRPVQVGYNLNGNGMNSCFTMKESMSSKVTELSQKSNVNITGKYIFRIENQSNF